MTEFFGSWNNKPDEDADEDMETTETVETITTTTTRTRLPSKSSSTKTTTMTTPAKLYGRELSTYDEVDVDELLAKLTQEELTMLAKEVDPDDNFLPPDQRNNYACEKDPTGPLNRKKLIEHINKQALETPDRPEVKPYVAGVVRGKKWIPPPPPEKVRDAEEQIAIDLGDEYEQALGTASQEEIIDLAAILGFHSMMNQDQYHASLLNKGQPVGLGWDGITKATKPKVYPMDPPNDTDPDETIRRVAENDENMTELNWNNIKNISDEKFGRLFAALADNRHVEVVSLVNVGLHDRTAALLCDALRSNTALRVLNVETNFISPAGVLRLVDALLPAAAVEEFRASNQRSQVLGNKIEMEITSLVEANPTLLRLGLHLEYSDARHRVASHLQRNIDRNCRVLKRASASLSLRLPRGRPPAVGIDNSFFNMLTPPSAEAVTPTNDVKKSIITEAVEKSVAVEAKDSPDVNRQMPTYGETIIPVSVDGETPATTDGQKPATDVDKPKLTDIKDPVARDLKEPSTTDVEKPLVTNISDPIAKDLKETVNDVGTPLVTDVIDPIARDVKEPITTDQTPVSTDQTPGTGDQKPETIDALRNVTEGQPDKFVLAERPDINPNPHSTPAASEPDERLEP